MKHLCIILATALAAALSAIAKTFDWPTDATTAGARQFTAYHGETARFNLQFKGATTNLAPVCIYYQTDSMDRAEWFEPIPGTPSSTRRTTAARRSTASSSAAPT